MKYHSQRLCAYLNIGRYIVCVYKQYVRIAFFRDTSFVVNEVGAQTVGILYLPLSFGGGILFYKHHAAKIRDCGIERKIAFIGHRHVYYAKRKGLDIINIFKEEDRPTVGMTANEARTYWDNLFSDPHKPK